MDLEKYLYERVLPILLGWNEEGIYAISFYVDTNDSNEFQGICDFPEFSICYNTEKEKTGEKWIRCGFIMTDMVNCCLHPGFAARGIRTTGFTERIISRSYPLQKMST